MKSNQIVSLVFLIPLVTVLASCATSRPSEEALRDLCQQPAQLDGRSHFTLLTGGYEALGKNDLSCAERLTTKAREIDPNDPFGALNLGVIYQKQGKKQQARTQYNDAIRLDSSERDGKEGSKASEATNERFLDRRPGEIAKRNLQTLTR